MDGRELTLTTVEHPLHIDGDVWLRVDHPILDPIQQGEATLGWEGDPRLVVYLHGESKTFVLWRLEHDGEYRAVATIPDQISPENVNSLCRRLVEIDTRTGFDAYGEVMAAQDKLDAEKDATLNEWVKDFSDKMLFGLARSHLPGVDIAKRTFSGFGGI